VDLMHVLHRPHLPRLVNASVAAFILAIVISLALASGLSRISQPSDNANTPAQHGAPASVSVLHAAAPRWARNPFASLLSRPLPQPWLTARR
jgi:hypothetical protein